MALSTDYCPSTVRSASLSYSFLFHSIRRRLSPMVVESSLSISFVADDELSFMAVGLSLSTTGFS